MFGSAGGFPANFDLTTLNGTNGFRIDGAAGEDRLGISVSGGADINGDGLSDIVVSAHYADNSGGNSGSAYVIFGHTGPFAPALSVAGLTGANGFRFDGAAANDYTGRSVSVLGDVNGDGIEDFIVGAGRNDATGSNSGTSYVVFGRDVDVTGNFQAADGPGRGRYHQWQ